MLLQELKLQLNNKPGEVLATVDIGPLLIPAAPNPL